MKTMADDFLQVNKADQPRPGSNRSTSASSASSTGSHRNKELLKSYHDLAAHIFSDGRGVELEQQFIAAARDGDYQKVSEFLQRMSQEVINIDYKDQKTGNTPIIWATKRGHTKIVQLLLKYGADITLRNYDNETALDVASPSIREILLDSVDRTGCTPRHLLQAAWQGNVKVLKRLLSESKMLDINCRNADGYTPLLLVTRDIDLFEKIGKAVKNYSPSEVVSILVQNRADVMSSDAEGKSCIHYASSSKSKLSENMVSFMLKDCQLVDAKDKRSFAAIHSASQSGQAGVVVALLDNGADVNCRGFAGVTPLHVSAQCGHDKVATTLLDRGADILLVDDSGNTAVDVAKTKKIKTKLKEAWSEATQSRRESVTLSPVKPPSRLSMYQQSMDENGIPSPSPDVYHRKRMSEVLFDGDDLPQADHPAFRNISPGKKKMIKKLTDADKAMRAEARMMQDIDNGKFTPRPNPRKYGMSRACSRCDSRNSMVITPLPITPAPPPEYTYPQQGSPKTPEKMPPISPFSSPSSPEKNGRKLLCDKKYRALNRSFEEDGVKNGKARAHQRLAQRYSDPTRKSVPEYSPIPVTVLGLELDDNLEEIRIQRVVQGPIGHMVGDKKKGMSTFSASQSDTEVNAGHFGKTYPQPRTARSYSHPSVTDVTEACNSFLKRGKRLPKSLSNVDNSDEITAPPPKLAPVAHENRLKIPFTIEEGKSTSPLILDLDQMHVRLSTDSPFNGSAVYPNSRSLLPPSPLMSQQNEQVHHDPVYSLHAEDIEEEDEDTHNAVQSNGVSHNTSGNIKLAVPDPMQLKRSRSFLDRPSVFNIERSRVNVDHDQQEAPLSSRSNESSSYSSSVSSLSTPSPRTSFDTTDIGPNLRKSGAQMTPAATMIIERPYPQVQQRKQTTLLKTIVTPRNEKNEQLKKPSSALGVLNRTYTVPKPGNVQAEQSSSKQAGENVKSQGSIKLASSQNSQSTMQSSMDKPKPVRRPSDSEVKGQSKPSTAAGLNERNRMSSLSTEQKSAGTAPSQSAEQKSAGRVPVVSTEPKSPTKPQTTLQGKPANSNVVSRDQKTPRTSVSSASKEVTKNNVDTKANLKDVNKVSTKDSPQNQQRKEIEAKQEKAEACQSSSTKVLFSRLASNDNSKAVSQTASPKTPGRTDQAKFNTPRNAISAGPQKPQPVKQNITANTPRNAISAGLKKTEPARQASTGTPARQASTGTNSGSPRKDANLANGKTSVPTSKSAGAALARIGPNAKESQKPEQKGTPIGAKPVNVSGKTGLNSNVKPGTASQQPSGKVTVHASQTIAELKQSEGNLRPTVNPHTTLSVTEQTDRMKMDAALKQLAAKALPKEVLSTSKQNQENKSGASEKKLMIPGEVQNKERKGSEKENDVKNKGINAHKSQPEPTSRPTEWGGAAEGKTQQVTREETKAVSAPEALKTDKQPQTSIQGKSQTGTTPGMKDQGVDKTKVLSSSLDVKKSIDAGKGTSKPKTEELLRKAAEAKQGDVQKETTEQTSVEITPVIYDMMDSKYMQREDNAVKVEISNQRVLSAGKRNLLSAPQSTQKRINSANKDGRKGSATSRSAGKRPTGSGQGQKQPSSAGKKKGPINKVTSKPGSGGKGREKSGSKVEKPKSAKGRNKSKTGIVNKDVIKKGKKGGASIITNDEADKTAFITGVGWHIKTGRDEMDVIMHEGMYSDDSSDSDIEDYCPQHVKEIMSPIQEDSQNLMPETMDAIKEFADTLKSNHSEDDHDTKTMSINDKIISEIRRAIETESSDRSPNVSWKVKRERGDSCDSQQTSASKSRKAVARKAEVKKSQKRVNVPIIEAPAGDGSSGLTPRMGFTDDSDNEGSWISETSCETNPDLMKVFCVPDHYESSEPESVLDEDVEDVENMEDEVNFESDRESEDGENKQEMIAVGNENVKVDSKAKITPNKNTESKPSSSTQKEQNAKKVGSEKAGNVDVKAKGLEKQKSPQKQIPEKSVSKNTKPESKQPSCAQKQQVLVKPGVKVETKANPRTQVTTKKPSEDVKADVVAKKPEKIQNETPKEVEKSETKAVMPKESASTEKKETVKEEKPQSRKPSDTSTKVVQKPPLPKKEPAESTGGTKTQKASVTRKESEKRISRTSSIDKGNSNQKKAEAEKSENVNKNDIGDDDVFEATGDNTELSPEQLAAKLSAENVEKLQTLLLAQTQEGGDHSPAVKLQRPSQREFDTMDSLNSLASEFFSQSLKSDATDLSDRTLTESISRPDSRTITSSLGKGRSAASTMRSDVSFTPHGDLDDQLIHWKKGHVLGRGAYGTVYCGLTNTGQLIAVKQVELSVRGKDDAEKQYEKLQEEVDLLKTLNHDNIVGFLGTCLEDHTVNIFMQFVPGGSIAQLLARFGALEEPVFCRYTKQILKGVDYLHGNNVIHRDIKGGNVMLMPTGVIKLIDFGCAKRLCLNLSQSQSRLLKSMRGTPYWMAPEVVMETGHGTKSDIWSIGCTIFEMATRKPPWSEMAPMAAIFAIGSGDKPLPRLPEKFSPEARNFVNACMHRDQDERPTAKDLLGHPFLAKKRETSSISDGQNGKKRDSKDKIEFKEKKS